jgi:hypothetical protein
MAYTVGDEVEVEVIQRRADLTLEKIWRHGVVTDVNTDGIDVEYDNGDVLTAIEDDASIKRSAQPKTKSVVEPPKPEPAKVVDPPKPAPKPVIKSKK